MDMHDTISLLDPQALYMQQVAQELGWKSVDTLVRLEGFSDPWEFAVPKGRSIDLAATLSENGITSDATITVVRRVFIPEAWKVTCYQLILTNAVHDSSDCCMQQ